MVVLLYNHVCTHLWSTTPNRITGAFCRLHRIHIDLTCISDLQSSCWYTSEILWSRSYSATGRAMSNWVVSQDQTNVQVIQSTNKEFHNNVC
jgi:hypothetical protein